MRIDTLKQYDKSWAKLSKQQQKRALQALGLFMQSPYQPSLRLHQLKGSLYPQYSISAGGDLRIHFLKTGEDSIVLSLIGTHAQLYG